MTTTLLLRGARVLVGEDFRCSDRALDVLVRGERIESIGPFGSLQGDEVVDLDGYLLAPGLVNGHFHSHEHFHKGRVENLPLELWMQHLRSPVPVVLDPRQTYLRTMVGAIDALHTGTTLVLDDLVLGGTIDRACIDAVLQAYEDIGIRALVGFAMIDRPIIDSLPFAADAFDAATLRDLRALRPPPAAELLDLCAGLGRARHPRTSRVGIAVSASAPQRCTDDFLRQCRALSDELDLPLVTHVHETRLQVVTGSERYGKSMIEHLDDLGFLSPRTSLIHAAWLTPREIEILARRGSTAQHNPWSNLMLGSGSQPVRALLDAGVNVSMGSDGTCSTMTANMLTVLGTAAAMSKIRGDDPHRWLSAREVFGMATRNAARALGFGNALGVIRPGAIADLVGYRLDTIGFTPLNDAVRQLVYAERGAAVQFSMVAGRPVMRDGRLTTIDEKRTLADIAGAHADLAAQMDHAARSAQPVLAGIGRILRQGLATPIPHDTYPARFP